MKICIVTPRYPPNTKGGGEISCSLLARELSKYCDVEVISFDGSTASESEIDGVKVIRIKACLLSASQSKIPINLQAYNYLKKRVKDYDIFQTYNMDLMPAVGLLTKFYGAKSVATLNGTVFSATSRIEWSQEYEASLNIKTKFIRAAIILRNKLMMQAIRNINYFTTLCPFKKEEFNEDGIPPEKVEVIPNILDSDFEVLKNIKNRKVRILYLGQFRWRKGSDILLSAYSLLKKQNVELIVAGYGEKVLGLGESKANIEELIKKLKIKNEVRFLDRIPYEKVPELYANTDIFVQPYRYPEPIGRTLLEALQCGVCVITTGNDYYSPIIKNMEHGVLIYPCTPEKLAEKMQLLIDNPALRERLAKNGQQRVQEVCSPEKIIPQYIKLHERLKR